MTQTAAIEVYEKEDLKRDLKSRHIHMIAIGGAIGTGLFYGSSWAIKTAGPAIILTFLVGAVAIYFVMRAFGGVENLGLAAGEAKDVTKTMPKAVNATFWRLLLFYVGAITVLVIIFPWDSLTGKGSPFVEVFERIGIPGAASVMNLVVITAVLSAVNASVFTNSRTFYNLSLQGNAPAVLGSVNGKNVASDRLLNRTPQHPVDEPTGCCEFGGQSPTTTGPNHHRRGKARCSRSPNC